MSTTTNNSQTISLAIEGMSCGHCVQAVRQALSVLPGITTQSVAVGSAVVASNDPAAASKALAALEEAGYSATVIPTGTMKKPAPNGGGGGCSCCGS